MKLPEQLVLFLDRALGKHKVANILLNSQDKYEGIEVVVHCLDDFFRIHLMKIG